MYILRGMETTCLVLFLLGCGGTQSEDEDTTTGTKTTSEPSDLDNVEECSASATSVDPSQRLNELSSAQVQELCTWYEQEWKCALSKADLCLSEGVKAGVESAGSIDEGAAICKNAEAECRAGQPAFYENLAACTEINLLTKCSATFSEYQNCLADTMRLTRGVHVDSYSCDNFDQYTMKQENEEWVSPASCLLVVETCVLN